MAKHHEQWTCIGIADVDVYVPLNLPTKALEMPSQRLIFGEVEVEALWTVETVMVRNIDEMATGGNGE